MAIAMARHNQTAIPDDGSILSDPQACPGGLFIDVLRGSSRLLNPLAPHPQHQAWYPLTEVHPVLVHFLGNYTTIYPYKREELRLALAVANRLPTWAADTLATMFCSIPRMSGRIIKNLLRPVYQRLFGNRPISASERM